MVIKLSSLSSINKEGNGNVLELFECKEPDTIMVLYRKVSGAIVINIENGKELMVLKSGKGEISCGAVTEKRSESGALVLGTSIGDVLLWEDFYNLEFSLCKNDTPTRFFLIYFALIIFNALLNNFTKSTQ